MKMPNILKHKVLTALLVIVFCLASVIGSSYAVTVTRVDLAQDTITAVTTTNQEAEAGTAVATPPQVKVEDAFGNVVAGVAVDFAVASGGGSIIGGSTITTDANGLAAVGGWTLGSTPGENTLTASNDHYAGSPVTFSATALADAETPTFSPVAGAVAHDATVTISSATSGATIYYTTDGSDPTTSSAEYSAAIPVTAAMNVKAIAVATGYGDSAVGSAAYTLSETAATPTFSPAAGDVTSGTSVTISSATSGATIYYTTDGSDPTTSSAEYSAAVSVTPPMTLKAIAVATGYNNSAVGSASYTQAATANLTSLVLSGSPSNYSFSGGTYTYDGITVANAVSSITVTPTATGGLGTITVNGTPVTSGSASAAINLTAGVEKTITVVVTETGKTSKTYTLKVTRALPAAATPTFSPVAGAVALGSTVTISSTTAGATIYYTTNGSDPTTSSTLYTGPVTISSAMTLKAIAVAANFSNSAVVSASYTQAATANLTSLVLSGSPSNYSFSGGTYTYDGITVANAVSSITVTPTGAGTITVDGTPVTSGSASAAINLTAGVEKTITVVVTETGKTPKTYTLKVTRDNPTLTFSIKSVVPKSESYNFGQDTYYYHVVTLKVDDGQGGAIQSSPSTPDVNNSIRVSTTEGASAAWPEYSVNGNEFTFETGGFLSFNSVNSVTIYAGAFTSTNGITTTSAKTVYP